MLCDLVAVKTDTVRTAGADPEQLPLVAAASDISDVIVGGKKVAHGDVAGALESAIAAVT